MSSFSLMVQFLKQLYYIKKKTYFNFQIYCFTLQAYGLVQKSFGQERERERERKMRTNLAEPEVVFFSSQLKAAADEDHDTASRRTELGINGADSMSALIEWQLIKLLGYLLISEYLLSFEGEHGGGLI